MLFWEAKTTPNCNSLECPHSTLFWVPLSRPICTGPQDDHELSSLIAGFDGASWPASKVVPAGLRGVARLPGGGGAGRGRGRPGGGVAELH